MKLNLAENLKRLRKECNVIQEDLADFIGVSFQAVSKWERGEGYPDITLLPSIAGFFNVTIDDLLGIDEIQNQERRDNILRSARKFSSEGNLDDCISELRAGLHDFPNDFRIALELAMFLDGYGNTSEERKNNSSESVKLCKRILEFCTDNKIRIKTQSCLCYSLWRSGDREEAIKIAEDLPTLYSTAETTLPKFLNGKERIEYCQTVIQKLNWHFWWLITCMIDGDGYSDEEKIELLKKSIALYEIVYERKDYAFSHCRLSSAYEDITILFLEQGKVDEGLENLEKCVDHAISYDTLPDNMKLSSLLVNKLEYKKQNTSRSTSKNHCRCLLESIMNDLEDKRSLYRLCEQKEKFKQIIEKLKVVAN